MCSEPPNRLHHAGRRDQGEDHQMPSGRLDHRGLRGAVAENVLSELLTDEERTDEAAEVIVPATAATRTWSPLAMQVHQRSRRTSLTQGRSTNATIDIAVSTPTLPQFARHLCSAIPTRATAMR